MNLFFDYKTPPFSIFYSRKEFFTLLNSFINKLTIGKYDGYWSGYGVKASPKMTITTFKSRKEILAYSKEFIEDLLTPVLKKYHKNIWADHTPTNLNHVLFLYELFPDMKFIHIYRDIRDVVSSYKTKSWGGNSAQEAVPIIKGSLEKWERDKKKLPPESYIEISLEQLVKNTKDTLEKICEFLGVEFDTNMLKMDLSKSHSGRWKKDLSKEEVELVERELGWFLKEKGYLD